jgi:hypothetical protein
MDRLLPMAGPHLDRHHRRGEPVISLLCGVPALTIGLGAIILLWSYLVDKPIGSAEFYQYVLISVEGTDGTGLVAVRPVQCRLPSVQLLAMLFIGVCWAGLGIHLSRRRWPQCRVCTSAAGLIACATAFCLAWLLLALAASR